MNKSKVRFSLVTTLIFINSFICLCVVAFLLPVNKRRRRNSEHYLKVSHQEEEGDMIRNQKYRRSRRKSGIY